MSLIQKKFNNYLHSLQIHIFKQEEIFVDAVGTVVASIEITWCLRAGQNAYVLW
jgi:hypothetical protein